jgi:DNA (cytosine-5)-methyltransferase 1
MSKYKLIDLFAGAGGITTGFHWAGFETVLANEYDISIANSYKHNYPNVDLIVDDIRNIDFDKIKEEKGIKKGEIDVIAGGPPCQGFSMANRKRIEDDTRNLLFLEFVRAVKCFEPKCFLIENVMGMKAENISIGKKSVSVQDSMAEYFNEIGYQISFKSFKAEEHGVPQIRRRVIIIGTKLQNKFKDLKSGKIGKLNKLHKPKNSKLSDEKQLQMFGSENVLLEPNNVWDAISDFPKLDAGEGFEIDDYSTKPSNKYQKFLRVNANKLHNHVSTPHSEKVLERISHIKQGDNFNQLPEDLKTKSVHSGAYGRLVANSLSPTITTRFDTPSTGRVIHPYQNRTITVREAARLQSFPDSFVFVGTRTSQGKQVGNAVPPLVAKAIAEMFITDFLENNKNGRKKNKPITSKEMSRVCD